MKKIFFLLLSLAMGSGLAAQEAESSPWAEIKANWYIDAGAGIQTLFTPSSGKLNFGKQLTPALHVGIGKWFNPYWGLHFGINGYNYNGYRSSSIGDLEPFSPLGKVDVEYDGSFRYYLRYMNMNADFRVSLLGLITGRERTDRFYDIIPYIGVGYMHAFPYRGTIKANLFTGHLGMRHRFQILDRLDANVDLTAMMTDRYMHPTSGRYTSTLSLTAGLTYYIGRRAFRRPVIHVPVEAVRYVSDTILVREVPVPGKDRVIERIITAQPSGHTIMASIRFPLNSYVPLEGQETQIYETGRFLRDNPDRVVLIEGYADATTGSSSYNKRLGEQRAEAIRKMLIEKYQVGANQIQTRAVGADEQPYEDEPVWNRVAIIRLIQ